MTGENLSSPLNLQVTEPPMAPTGRPAVVGRIGTFSAATGVEFAGRSVLNVVWHLQSLGFEPLLITRIGNDAEGRQVSQYLEKSGIDLEGVQIDDSLTTSGETMNSGERDLPCCAWEALDWKSAVDIIDRVEPPVLFHGVAATSTEPVQKSLSNIQSRTAVPFFVDLDLGKRTPTMDSVRRALLGVKWIRVDAAQLPELAEHTQSQISRSVLKEALNVQARFALEGIVVEHHGLPFLGIWRDRIARSTISPPADTTFLPGGRDAATAALIVSLLLGWGGHVMVERAAQFAYLAGAAAIAERVEPFIYSTVLRHWRGSESHAAES